MKITDGKITVTSSYLNAEQKRDLLLDTKTAIEVVGVDLSKVDSLRVSVRKDVMPGKQWAAVIRCKSPGNYQINLRINVFYSPRSRASMLIHEVTHLKQYVSGELMTDAKGNDYWNGKLITEDIDATLELGDEVYENLPWEIEPYRNERELLEQFFVTKMMLENVA